MMVTIPFSNPSSMLLNHPSGLAILVHLSFQQLMSFKNIPGLGLGMVFHTYNSSYWEVDVGGSRSKVTQEKCNILSEKQIKRLKRTGGHGSSDRVLGPEFNPQEQGGKQEINK
jgi:hypothetical protein